MTSLTRFESNNGIELVIDTLTGEAFATQSGYARMSGKDRTTIVRRCQGCVDKGIKTAETLTPGGLQRCVLIPADTVFDWLLVDNVELARVMGKAGATLYIYQEVGFKISSSPVELPKLQLSPSDIRVSNLVNALQALSFDLTNPRFNQELKDLAGDILGLTKPALPLSEPVETWVLLNALNS
jgi:hypothetical protein